MVDVTQKEYVDRSIPISRELVPRYCVVRGRVSIVEAWPVRDSQIHTTVPPSIIEAAISKVGKFGQDIQYSFPYQIPSKLRGIREGGLQKCDDLQQAYQVLHHEGKN